MLNMNIEIPILVTEKEKTKIIQRIQYPNAVKKARYTADVSNRNNRITDFCDL